MAGLAEPVVVIIHYYKMKAAVAAFAEQSRKKNVSLKEFLLSILSMFQKYMFSKRLFRHK